ncbi:MAG: Asp-tRNA(Asn)/Glu-tRNA(Gln) amidotransferase subunit GatC, partial [Aristaeellaceae bacterium]
EDLPYLLTDPGRVRSQAYDVVLNGVELGSGSIRIHRPEVQALMFKALGFSEESARQRFSFLIDAFRYGTPPHGGFAFGLDRLVMLLLGADSLRDVIAFPKVRDASCLMTGAPDFVDPEQLEVLQLGTAAAQEKSKAAAAPKPKIVVQQVAQLAKLSLSPEEEKRMGGEMEGILAFAQALQQVDTTGVPMTAHVIPTQNVLREDEPETPFDREKLLASAPTRTEECVTVPKTFE